MRILHAADLHLSSAEADYGFSVLDEVLSLAAPASPGAESVLLLSGDVFDSWADLADLYCRFRAAVEAAPPGLSVLVAAGNHDLLGASGDPARYDFGPRVTWAWKEALVVQRDEAEFILLPYGALLPDAASLPPARKTRIIAAHGAMPEMNWLGPAEEGGTKTRANLDATALVALSPDYTALGHIHDWARQEIEGVPFAYPGSARVWRRGEAGQRAAQRLDLQARGKKSPERVGLKSAGQYRLLEAALAEDGSLDEAGLRKLVSGSSPGDWLDIRLSGLAQREEPLSRQEAALKAGILKGFRKVEISHDEVVFLGEEASSEAAAAFRRAWEGMLPALTEKYGAAAARKALEIGLRKVEGARAGASS